MNEPIKTYADCYMYSKYPKYNTMLFEAMMTENFIDKGSKQFEDVIYDIKRTKINEHILQVLMSPKTVLILPEKHLPSFFNTFVAKDPRSKNKERKLFIDCTNSIKKDSSGNYIANPSRLLGQLISGFYTMKYSVQGMEVFRMSQSMILAATCFSQLFTYLIDYLAKISVNQGSKDKCNYLAARYFLEGICNVEESRSREIARKISGITEIKENTFSFNIKEEKNSFTELKPFILIVKNVFKIEKLTVDIIIEKWMYLFGPITVFALEYAPSFITMMTDAYNGSFVNNQKTIEKICGKSMVEFAKIMINNI